MTASADPLIGRRLSRYRVLERVGAGAMGVVYRAHDERLERDVAVKVLPPSTLPDESSRRRFEREARALSRVVHANIEVAFDVGCHEGTEYLVTEFVPGRTLLERLGDGVVGEPEAVAIGVQLADALQAAHDHGVVHGDVKPANVLVTPGGQVKLLDFGLARLRGAAAEDAPTRTAFTGEVFAGTLGYAAPEMFLGGGASPATDIYALGVVLYELATGRRPHEETLTPALIYAILHNAPAPPRKVRPGLSAALEQLVLSALERDPERRTPTAAALATALRAIGATPGAAVETRAIRAIAVLPLANFSADPSQEFLADGITDALITCLSRIRALRVISRTSAMSYKGAAKPLPQIARELRVDAVIEGSVVRAGGRVRVTAQLVEASSDTQLWSESYERDLDDILRLQSDVAQAIADSIKVTVTPEERASLGGDGGAVNPDAHLAYLRGRFLWNKWTPDHLHAAIEQFQHALALDPRYAAAYAGLADSYSVLGNINAMPHGEAYGTARAMAQAGLAIDDGVAELHGSLGYVLRFHDWDWQGAEHEFRRSVELNPGYATGLRWHAQLLSGLGRHAEAIAEARRALDLDPLSLIIYSAVGDVYFYARQYDRAIDYYRRSVAMDASFLPGHTDLARALEQKGLLDEAMAEYRLAAALERSDPGLSAGLAHTLALAGRRDESRAILGRLVDRHHREFTSTFAIATIHACLGDCEGAFEWLERAFELRDGALAFLNVHPRLDGLRREPRFAIFLARMGFPASA
jgi:eukaryotic-like serine/threonine-protein kinase